MTMDNVGLSGDDDESSVKTSVLFQQDRCPATQCLSCGMPLGVDYGDQLCQTCFVAHGIDTVSEIFSTQAQQALFENLLMLSHHAHQREQTDAAYHSLSAAYHAAYQPSQLDVIVREAQIRFDEWEPILDECGEVRADDYQRLTEEARKLKRDMIEMMGNGKQ
jgi:hypothetical protein